ncbi:MAG: CinA family protein [Gammaproteobacteria bacterium]|nr:CinA family protein [Gammaproteobacteria bacterium]MDX2462589.1 CinA family protein [Gammaproteobacteria bacterium]
MNEGSLDSTIDALAEKVGESLSARGLMLATAESCTGGWASAAVTAVSGSSAWFERGFVTYSNAAKREMLGVKAETLAAHGAVSEAVVKEMAEGAIARSGAQAGLAISGIAGPGGGSAAKPVGLVCLGWAVEGGETRARCLQCPGGREDVRREAVVLALEGLLEWLSASPGKR